MTIIVSNVNFWEAQLQCRDPQMCSLVATDQEFQAFHNGALYRGQK